MAQIDRAIGAFAAAICWLPLAALVWKFPWFLVVALSSVLCMRTSRRQSQLIVGSAWYKWGFINALRFAHGFTKDLTSFVPVLLSPLRRRWNYDDPPPDVLFVLGMAGIFGYSFTILLVAMNPLFAIGDAFQTLLGICPDDCLVALGLRPTAAQVLCFGLREGVAAIQPWSSLYFAVGCKEAMDKVGREDVMRKNGLSAPRTYFCGVAQEMATVVVPGLSTIFIKPNLGAAAAEVVECDATKDGHVPESVLKSLAPNAEYLLQDKVVGILDSRAHSFRAITVRIEGREAELFSLELLVAVYGEHYSNSACCGNRLLFARGCELPEPAESDGVVSEGVRKALQQGSLVQIARSAADVHSTDLVLSRCLVIAWDFTVTKGGNIFYEFNYPCYLNEMLRRMQTRQLAPLWEFWREIEADMRARVPRGPHGIDNSALVD
mmetsp:Transcript_85662/g.239334  ORF Transcript_85662/g.239334 Transcript_85662/m.239334 type:complete len:435 (+) Transcript_85662:112-1416(+)